MKGPELPFESLMSYVEYPMGWHNSNRLLTVPGFKGVKTGITPTAGSCLSVWFERGETKLITVVLGSRSIEHRWKDAWRLTMYAAAVQEHTRESQQPKQKCKKVESSSPFKY